jgi:choline dehydrogenase-like flavoprotein
VKDDAIYDAIVIGSGMTGGWAAKELTEKGLKTLVLEAGRLIVPEEDYVEHVPPWEMRFRGMRDRRRQMDDQPIQSTCYACDEWSAKFFVNDKEHPYTTAPGKPFRWIRGRQVGGRSIVWGRQVYRWSDLDFEANLRDGIAIDWPIRYADVAPWYDYVEDFIGITGEVGPATIARQQVPSADGVELRGISRQGRDRKTFRPGSRFDDWACRCPYAGSS